MSRNSDDEYLSAEDEDTSDDKLLKPQHSEDFQGVTEPNDPHTTNCASSVREQQPEVVKVLDNKYVSDAESLKSGGVVELTEEQRKVSANVYSVL